MAGYVLNLGLFCTCKILHFIIGKSFVGCTAVPWYHVVEDWGGWGSPTAPTAPERASSVTMILTMAEVYMEVYREV